MCFGLYGRNCIWFYKCLLNFKIIIIYKFLIQLKKVNPPSPCAASDTKLTNQSSVIDNSDFNPVMQVLNQPDKVTQPTTAMDTPNLTFQQSIEEEDNIGEMLENIKLERTEAKNFPKLTTEPKKTTAEPEEVEKYQTEELRKLEIEKIEEKARKEKEQLQKEQEKERKKKDLLLAKLKELDNKPQTLTNVRNDLVINSLNRTNYTFTKEIENLHQGRPSNDLDFLDSQLKLNQGKPNSIFKSNQSNVGTPFQKGNRLTSRKSDNMIEDFFTSTVSPKNDDVKMSDFVNGDMPIFHSSSESKTKSRKSKMESNVYKELFGENVDDSISINKDDLILGDLNRPNRQDWVNQTVGSVGGLFNGDGLNNSYKDGSKLLPSRQQVSIFETRSAFNAFDNSSDSIEEIIL